jgi:hypothetical protein
MLIPAREIKHKAAWQGRRVALAAVAGTLLAIGAAFLSAALWSAIRFEYGPVVASLILAALFALGGLIALLVRRSPPEPRIPTLEEQLRKARAAGKPYPPPEQLPALMDAFFFGMNLYLRLREPAVDKTAPRPKRPHRR